MRAALVGYVGGLYGFLIVFLTEAAVYFAVTGAPPDNEMMLLLARGATVLALLLAVYAAHSHWRGDF